MPNTAFALAQIFLSPSRKLLVGRLIQPLTHTKIMIANQWHDTCTDIKRPRQGQNMLSVHMDNIGEMAVIECEGRIVRSEDAFALRKAVNLQSDARIIVLDLSEVTVHRRRRSGYAGVSATMGSRP